jgi:hypothetical protein
MIAVFFIEFVALDKGGGHVWYLCSLNISHADCIPLLVASVRLNALEVDASMTLILSFAVLCHLGCVSSLPWYSSEVWFDLSQVSYKGLYPSFPCFGPPLRFAFLDLTYIARPPDQELFSSTSIPRLPDQANKFAIPSCLQALVAQTTAVSCWPYCPLTTVRSHLCASLIHQTAGNTQGSGTKFNWNIAKAKDCLEYGKDERAAMMKRDNQQTTANTEVASRMLKEALRDVRQSSQGGGSA